jgi:hypothetical protein
MLAMHLRLVMQLDITVRSLDVREMNSFEGNFTKDYSRPAEPNTERGLSGFRGTTSYPFGC